MSKFLNPYVAQKGEIYDVSGLSEFQLSDVRLKLARRQLRLWRQDPKQAQILAAL